MRDTLHLHFGRRVELRSHGIIYRGKLVGADEEFIYLIGVMGWIILPLETVTSVKPEGATEAERDFERLPGERPPSAEEREAKRRYSPRDLQRVHEPGDENEGNTQPGATVGRNPREE